ncbi:amidase family protein [Facklamia sp. 7083-14-GEN3]|uniref:amidase family protein n=1 Tax=Facklamia sp. 7083-14-GEN3 TaxID=2973478 RepID=UPI00215BF8DE|nr:amidase family protein [Facklamia sp. 7083-14-GEN3]MCR8969753.1 amidase family protein [Facklamia sp. 7083-14-GEN3]
MKKTLTKQALMLTTIVLNAFSPILGNVYAEDQLATEETTSESNLNSQSSLEDVSQNPLTVEEYKTLDASTLAAMIRSGQTTSKELIQLAFQVIEETNPDLKNILSIRKEEAFAEAEALEDTGQPFYGVPMLVKGLGHGVKGGVNSLGIEFLQNETFAEDSGYVEAFRDAGFIIIGQSTYPQYGWINVTNSELYGNTHNPWNLDHNPGGSSGGSAAAVAIGQVPVASSSDAGGSTRIPASWSGLIGLHPSRGILLWDEDVQENQTTHFAETKSMQDTIELFENLLKDKEDDSILQSSFDKTTPIAYTTQTPAGTPISQDAINAVTEVVEFLESEGFQLVEVDYPIDGKKLMEQYYILASSAAGSLDSLAEAYLDRAIEKEDVELLTWALYQTSKDLKDEDVAGAWEYIQQITEEMNEFYKQYPIFLTATNAYPAPEAGYNHISDEIATKMQDMSKLNKEEKLKLIYDQWLPAWTLTPYTQLANLTGTPALSLPTYVTENDLPMGVMFNTFAKNDRSLLEIGQILEEAGRFKTYYNR